MKLNPQERNDIKHALKIMKERNIKSCICLVENMETNMTVALAEKLLKE